MIARRLTVAALLSLALCLASASAASAAPWWRLSSRAAPSNLPPGGRGLIVVGANDLGNAGVSGASQPITLKDSLPQGITLAGGASAVHAHRSFEATGEQKNWSCASEAQVISCTTSLQIPPYEGLEMEIPVQVSPSASEGALENAISVQGGQAQEAGGPSLAQATLSRPLRLSSEPVSFSVEEGGFQLRPENSDGSLDDQAGSHPYQFTTTLDFAQDTETLPEGGLRPTSPALTRNLSVSLPPGLLGDVQASEQCSEADFSALAQDFANLCPAASVVGVAKVSVNIRVPAFGFVTHAVPLFNLVPAPGEPARFGFEIFKVPVILDASVVNGGDYGVQVKVTNAPETAQILGSEVTFWGVPGDQSHDSSRGWKCLLGGAYSLGEACTAPTQRSLTPFLTLPTSCEGQLNALVMGESWDQQSLDSGYVPIGGEGQPASPLQGCEALPFSPALSAQAIQPAEEGHAESQSTQASAPTGLGVQLKLPQALSTLSASSLGEADLKSSTVTLPQGMLLDPSAAYGLQACSEAQIGYQGQSASDLLSPAAPSFLGFSGAKAQCPQASKLGTVHIKTPLLAEELQGGVYLAEPAPLGEGEKNPFNSLIALYIVAENEALGVNVKLAGEGQLNPQTGQISTTFQNTPQVPFEELRLTFFGGPRAPLSTPSMCGDYRTTATFTPWSSPFEPALQTETAPGELQITQGQGGSPCPENEPFAPTITAGSANPQAGAFSSFALTIDHPDGDQPLSSLSIKLPEGAAAMLSTITPCPEPAAAQGSCSSESQIGKAIAQVGLGEDPYTQEGKVFITGPYQGAPFGLEVATPAVAGPFNLGMVVVRSKIEVDRHTAQVSISGAIPTFIQGVGMPATGIPIDLKRIYVDVDREGFQFNPTSCAPKQITAELGGAQGANANLSYPFQAQNCASLPFTPEVKAQTEGQASKANGASLELDFKDKAGQANVAKTILTIPSSLPARLSTIQKSCLAKVFEENPASCPEGSDIGSAVVHTPVLKAPLEGPIYLVSHGNAAWPDAELVLQGEGITVILDGQTAIKKGITTSSFLSVPDAPFSSLEASLPQGPHSALTANVPEAQHYSLCSQKLAIPAQLAGQNGAQLEEKVPVSIQGCHQVKGLKAKKLTWAQKLKKALASCRRRLGHSKARRQSCEAKARGAYGAHAAKKARHSQASSRPARHERQRHQPHRQRSSRAPIG